MLLLYSAFISFGDMEFNRQIIAELGLDDAINLYAEYKRQDAKQIHASMLNLLNQTKVFTAELDA